MPYERLLTLAARREISDSDCAGVWSDEVEAECWIPMVPVVTDSLYLLPSFVCPSAALILATLSVYLAVGLSERIRRLHLPRAQEQRLRIGLAVGLAAVLAGLGLVAGWIAVYYWRTG